MSEAAVRGGNGPGLAAGWLELTTGRVVASRESVVKVITASVRLDWDTKVVDCWLLLNVTGSIAKGLKESNLAILESSVPLGTAEKVLKPALERKSRLATERDFLANSPERVYIGRAVEGMERNCPKTVGGVSPLSLDVVAGFYERIVEKGVIGMDSTRRRSSRKPRWTAS